MYIESLLLQNLRCFRKVPAMVFQFPGRKSLRRGPPVPQLANVNLLLGNNGTGKSTILKAIALAMIGPILANSGFRPYNLVRRVYTKRKGRPPEHGYIEAKVLLTGQDLTKRTQPRSDKLFLELARRGDNDFIYRAPKRSTKWIEMDRDQSPAFLVLAYGATRRMAPSKENITARSKDAHLRFQRVRSLFEEDFSLVPLSFWLPNYNNPGRKKQVIGLVNELLDGQYAFGGVMEKGEYLFERAGARVPLPALSDGYRAFLSWVGDMLFHICQGSSTGKKLRQIEGVVMVDEIDLHLHPEWQRRIISTLSRAFPGIQFIFTSHSPLLTGSLEWPNIWVMNQDTPTQLPDEPIHGLSADQVLLSPYFGVRAVRSDEKMQRLADLELAARGGDVKAARDFMRELSTGMEAGKYGESGSPTHADSPVTPVPANPKGWAATVAQLKPPPPRRPSGSPGRRTK